MVRIAAAACVSLSCDDDHDEHVAGSCYWPESATSIVVAESSIPDAATGKLCWPALSSAPPSEPLGLQRVKLHKFVCVPRSRSFQHALPFLCVRSWSRTRTARGGTCLPYLSWAAARTPSRCYWVIAVRTPDDLCGLHLCRYRWYNRYPRTHLLSSLNTKRSYSSW